MAGTSKRYYVVNDNYNQDLGGYFGTSYPSKIRYKQMSGNSDTSIIIFKEDHLPEEPGYEIQPPGISYPNLYVGDTLHPSVDGTNKYVITMSSTIDFDRHPKFYVVDSPSELLTTLHKLFPAVSTSGNTNDVLRNLLAELHGLGNGYLTYNNTLYPGIPFPFYQVDAVYAGIRLVVDPYFPDCWDRTNNSFYDISYAVHTEFSSPNGLPSIDNPTGAFTNLSTNPIINPTHFTTADPITSTGHTMGIEFWVKDTYDTDGEYIPAFIRGWSSGTISCGVTILDGTIHVYSNGSLLKVSQTNAIDASGWYHVYVSYEVYGSGIGIKVYVNGSDATLNGVTVVGNAVVGTHNETTSIGCYTTDGTSVDNSKPKFGPTHQIAMIRYYNGDAISIGSEVSNLYLASFDRFRSNY